MLKRDDIDKYTYAQALDNACEYLSWYVSKELGCEIKMKEVRKLLLQDLGVRFLNTHGPKDYTYNLQRQQQQAELDMQQQMQPQMEFRKGW